MRTIAIKLLLAMISGMFLTAGCVVLFYVFTPLPDIEIENIASRQSTALLDRNGKFLFDFSKNEKRTRAPIEEIPETIINATIAIEDHKFFEHNGIRIEAFLRALVNNALTLSFNQGGSTITQQVTKNIFLTTEKNIERKMKEFFLARKIEKKLSKEEILELYLNTISYGGVFYGVSEASNAFFGKKLDEITVAEAAYLAAIPNAPTYFSPYGMNRKALEKRKNHVLGLMLEQNLITREEYTKARGEKVHFQEQGMFSVQAPHFVFFVREHLEKEHGSSMKALEGKRIHTSLDLDLQKKVEKLIQEFAPKLEEKNNAKNIAAVVLLAKTGEIAAMVGSKDFFDETIDGGVNIITSPRQPGSTFKPIVYARAFEKGFRPETVVYDARTQFAEACDEDDFRNSNEDDCYSPINYTGTFSGPVTLREALARSINIPSVKVLYLAGVRETVQLAKKMGITTLTESHDHYGLSLALGSGEITPLEMAQAYGVFANEGILKPYTWKKTEEQAGGKRVLSKETAREITGILADDEARAPAFGRNTPLNITRPPVAVKTGTTNNMRDIWIVGYSPGIVVAVWAGNSKGDLLENDIAGFTLSPLFRDILLAAAEKYEKEGVYFTGNTNPGEIGPEILFGRTGREHHSILRYIDKDDLTRETENPEDDPQYKNWEFGVQNWREENGDRREREEREERRIGTFRIVSPRSGERIRRDRTVKIRANGIPLENTTYEFYVNDILIGSSDLPLFRFNPSQVIREGETRVRIRVLANTTRGVFTAEKSYRYRE